MSLAATLAEMNPPAAADGVLCCSVRAHVRSISCELFYYTLQYVHIRAHVVIVCWLENRVVLEFDEITWLNGVMCVVSRRREGLGHAHDAPSCIRLII